MKTINNNNLKNILENMKKNETIFININKDFSNIIKLYDIKFKSLENLFISYINNTCEEANKINLDLFLNKYSKYFFYREYLINKILKQSLNTSYKYFFTHNFNFKIDYDLNILSITKEDNK